MGSIKEQTENNFNLERQYVQDLFRDCESLIDVEIDPDETDECNGNENIRLLNDIVIDSYETDKKYFLNDNSDTNICEHEYMNDLIDVDPDNSQVIKYCSKCFYVCMD